jgi:glycosyltransferase involved in cell wall biosynthesis
VPYKIALLSKYPPLEGGIAAKTYWLARSLAQRGHNVHVITHPVSAGKEYNVQGAKDIPLESANLQIHRPPKELPWHLPEDNEYSLALLDLTVEVIRKYGIQILDSSYLVPYGILSNLAKRITGVPYIVRHGGSDLVKFLKSEVLPNVIKEAIVDADIVITDKVNKGLFKPMTSRIVCHPPYVACDQVFTPPNPSQPQWRVAAIGKINYYWQHKGLDRIIEIMTQLSPQFECLIVGQGKGISDLQRQVGVEVNSKIKWCPFVPPWEMPGLLRTLDAIFIFDTFSPHFVFSNLAVEALCTGIGVITDRADFMETYSDVMNVAPRQVLTVSPKKYLQSAEAIVEWIQELPRARDASYQKIRYEDYVSLSEKTYETLLAAKS